MISNDQELIQSDPTSCPQNQNIYFLTFTYNLGICLYTEKAVFILLQINVMFWIVFREMYLSRLLYVTQMKKNYRFDRNVWYMLQTV